MRGKGGKGERGKGGSASRGDVSAEHWRRGEGNACTWYRLAARLGWARQGWAAGLVGGLLSVRVSDSGSPAASLSICASLRMCRQFPVCKHPFNSLIHGAVPPFSHPRCSPPPATREL